MILFSEWTTMLDLIEPLLDASASSTSSASTAACRKSSGRSWSTRSRPIPDCRLFLTTNAGSTGLNLQAANTVINVDLPWNPAVLEQRIARAHRMGQKQPVQVFVLVTEETIEENLLATLAAKKELGPGGARCRVRRRPGRSGQRHGGAEEPAGSAARRPAHAPLDETVQQESVATTEKFDEIRRERVAAAGGELLGAAFKLLGELIALADSAAAPAPLVENVRAGLGACVDDDGAGRPRLTITLPDKAALDNLAATLAKLLALGGASQQAAPAGS